MKKLLAFNPFLAALIFFIPLEAVSVLFFRGFKTDTWVFILLTCTSLVIGVALSLYLWSKPLARATDRLNNACDPDPMLAETELRMNNTSSKALRCAFAFSHIILLAMKGELDRARVELNELNFDSLSVNNQFKYYITAATICLDSGNLDKCGELLDRAQNLLIELAASPEIDRLKISLRQTRAQLHLRRGALCDGDEELLTAEPAENACLLEQVTHRYTRGLYAKFCGRYDEAAADFGFVISNAPKLAAAREAQSILDSLN